MNSSILMAGWASEDITPDKRVLLFGQFGERISEGVHDPITATALAIEVINDDGSKDHVMMVSCDLGGSDSEVLSQLRMMLNGELEGFNVDKIITCATHTHTAPCILNGFQKSLNWFGWEKLSTEEFMTPEKYMEFLLQKLKKVVTEAWNSRKPSKVSWELGHAVLGHCRRVVYDDRAIMYGPTDIENFRYLEGPSDHGVELMYFWDMEDNLTGIIVNAACPAQVVESKKVISADYFGAARRIIKERLPGNVYVLPQLSPAGDQSPRDLIRRGKSETTMLDFEGVEELGSRVADTVIKIYDSAKRKAHTGVALKHTVENIYLPIRQVSQNEVEWAEKKYDELMKNYSSESELKGKDLINLTIYRAILKRKKIQQTSYFFKMEMHAVRLGETAFVTNPFELFIDYGFRIKARSKAVQTFTIQMSCASAGYLPTEKALQGGSYSTNISDNIVGPAGGDQLTEHSIRAVNSLWDDEDQFAQWKFGG